MFRKATLSMLAAATGTSLYYMNTITRTEEKKSHKSHVEQTSVPADNNTAINKKIALSPNEFRTFKLISTEKVAHNTTRQKFELQSPEHETGLTVASCIVLKAEIDGKKIVRPYTPISLNGQRGYVELLVKSYPAPGGIMSRHIQSLKPKEGTIEMKGPFKKIDYTPNMKKKIGMIAGGTGITPMLQVIREILSNPEDRTQISLLFANVTEGDILLRAELDALAYLYPNFRVYYTLDSPPKGWTGGVGFVSNEMIKKRMPTPGEDTLILVCGPKGMVEHVAGAKEKNDSQGRLEGLLKKAGYHETQVYKF